MSERILRITGRSYYPGIEAPEIQRILILPQEMVRYDAQGIIKLPINQIVN